MSPDHPRSRCAARPPTTRGQSAPCSTPRYKPAGPSWASLPNSRCSHPKTGTSSWPTTPRQTCCSWRPTTPGKSSAIRPHTPTTASCSCCSSTPLTRAGASGAPCSVPPTTRCARPAASRRTCTPTHHTERTRRCMKAPDTAATDPCANPTSAAPQSENCGSSNSSDTRRHRPPAPRQDVIAKTAVSRRSILERAHLRCADSVVCPERAPELTICARKAALSTQLSATQSQQDHGDEALASRCVILPGQERGTHCLIGSFCIPLRRNPGRLSRGVVELADAGLET